MPQPGNPQDLNRYAYVRNSPLNATDPSGHGGIWEYGGGGGGTPIVDLELLLYVQTEYSLGYQDFWARTYYFGSPGIASGSSLQTRLGVDLGPDDSCRATQQAESGADAASDALRLNYERGLQLTESGHLPEHIDFFTRGMSDGPVPPQLPTADIQAIIGNVRGYVVGKPVIGADLDLILVGEQIPQLTAEQLQVLNSLAQQAGYTEVHVQVMNYSQAAAFRFATQATTPLHAVPNPRNPMLWRLIGGE